jgi:hypothetical protein
MLFRDACTIVETRATPQTVPMDLVKYTKDVATA